MWGSPAKEASPPNLTNFLLTSAGAEPRVGAVTTIAVDRLRPWIPSRLNIVSCAPLEANMSVATPQNGLMQTVKFVGHDASGRPLKRKQVSQACDACKKKKVCSFPLMLLLAATRPFAYSRV